MAGLGSLFIDLLARTGKFETDIGRAARIAERESKKIQDAFGKKLQQTFDDLGRKAQAAVAGYLGVQTLKSIISISDEYTQLKGRLALVTKGTEELGEVQKSLFGIAQRTRTEMTSVADLYIKVAQSGKELGASQQDLLKFTEGIGNALTVSGSSAQGASGALQQLSQLLSGAKVQAEEFNSINDGAPEILRTVAKNIDGMGGSIGKLRQAVIKGNVSSKDFFQAFLKGSDDLAQRAQSMPVTVGQAFIRMQNNINQAIGSTDMSPLVSSINELSSTISDPSFQQGMASLIGGIVSVGSVALQALGPLGSFVRTSGELGALLDHLFGREFSAADKLTFEGPSDDDLNGLKQTLDLVEKIRSSKDLNRLRVFGKDGIVKWWDDEELDAEIAKLRRKLTTATVNEATATTIKSGIETNTNATPSPPSEEFLKLSAALEKQIALHGTVGKAAEISAEIQAGLLDKLSKSEQEQYLALGRRYDAVVKLEEQQKKGKQEQDQAQNSIRKQIESVEEQIATFEKGEAAAVAYRLAHGELAKAFGTSGQNSDELNKKIDALTSQMEHAGNESGTVSEAVSDFAEENKRNLDKSLGSFKSDFEESFGVASKSTEDLADKLIMVTMHLELLKDAAKGAAEAVSDFASQNSEALNQSLDVFETDFEKRFIKKLDVLTVFQEQAARNMQDIIADTLISGFDKGINGVLKSFGDMIIKLTAQAVAADIAAKLFGEKGGGTGKGWISMAAGWLGSAFGGGRAIGGPVLAGTTYRINEREPEFFRPRMGGDIIPLSKMPSMGGGLVLNQSFSVKTETGERVSRRTEQQIAAAASRGLAMASRRNN